MEKHLLSSQELKLWFDILSNVRGREGHPINAKAKPVTSEVPPPGAPVKQTDLTNGVTNLKQINQQPTRLLVQELIYLKNQINNKIKAHFTDETVPQLNFGEKPTENQYNVLRDQVYRLGGACMNNNVTTYSNFTKNTDRVPGDCGVCSRGGTGYTDNTREYVSESLKWNNCRYNDSCTQYADTYLTNCHDVSNLNYNENTRQANYSDYSNDGKYSKDTTTPTSTADGCTVVTDVNETTFKAKPIF